MKEAYTPYAGVVLPHLLKRATDPSDVEISVRYIFLHENAPSFL